MKVFVIFTAMLTGLAACSEAISPKPFTGPDNRQAFAMKCSGFGRTLSQCYAKSGELCPLGYDIIDVSSGVAAVPTSTGGFIAAPQHSLAIQCR